MFENAKEKIKTKSFWAGVLAAAAGYLAGSYNVPELITKLLSLIGG